MDGKSEAFVKIQKKNIFFFFGGGGRVRGVGLGGSGWMGTEKEAFVKIHFFFGGGGSGRGRASGWGVRVDVNGDVKFL